MALSALRNAYYTATRKAYKVESRGRILHRDLGGLHDFNGAKTKRASSDYRADNRSRTSNGFTSASGGVSTKKFHELHSFGK